MTKLVFLILITVFVSLLNTTSITAAHANENSSYDHSICIFSIIICLNDKSQQLEESEEPANEEFIFSHKPSQFH
jgi:hypothetical protein